MDEKKTKAQLSGEFKAALIQIRWFSITRILSIVTTAIIAFFLLVLAAAGVEDLFLENSTNYKVADVMLVICLIFVGGSILTNRSGLQRTKNVLKLLGEAPKEDNDPWLNNFRKATTDLEKIKKYLFINLAITALPFCVSFVGTFAFLFIKDFSSWWKWIMGILAIFHLANLVLWEAIRKCKNKLEKWWNEMEI